MAKKRTRKSEAPSPAQNTEHNYNPLVSFFTKTVSIGLIVASPLVPEGSPESFQNWPMVLLWLLACAGIFAGYLLEPKKRWQLNSVDICFYGVCFWAMISGSVSLIFQSGHARPTINAIWQWIGFAVSFFVLRALMTNLRFRRTVILAVFGIAIGCSCAGLYQKFVTFPAIRADYQKLDEESKRNALRKSGISNVEIGSVERTMWENRLFSTEVTSTFVLANSLAAFLTPCCILALSVFIRCIRSKSAATIAVAGIALMLVFYCLLITKSRTGLLAFGIGTPFLFAFYWKNSAGKFPWRWATLILVAIGATVSTVWFSGVIEMETIKDASKSILYRIEYWQTSMEMIKDHWLFGCGPGNFQQYYSSYQLPQSSETVSDPHNFLIEIWSNAGTPAVIFLIVGLVSWVLTSCKCCIDKSSRPTAYSESIENDKYEKESPVENDDDRNTLNEKSSTAMLFLGVLLGLSIGFFQSITSGMEVGLIIVSGATCLVFLGGVLYLTQSKSDALTPSKSDAACFSSNPVSDSVALFAFAIGLCAAGGIGFPSVAILGIVLLAATLSQFDSYQWPVPQWFAVAGILICVIGFFLFRYTVVDPIQNAKQHQNVAEQAINRGKIELANSELEKAIIADPADGNYLFFQVQLHFRKFEQQPTLEHLAKLIELTEKAVKARPHHSKVALESGKLFLSLSKRVAAMDQNEVPNAEMLKRLNATMVDLFFTAYERRPNDAQHVAYLAYAFEMCEDLSNAKKWADVALNLDAINPHKDRDLNRFPFRFSGAASEDSIEQELQRIRSK